MVVDVAEVVPVVREPGEPRPVEVHCQRIVTGHQNVQPQVKLFVADQKRVMNVPLHDIRLGLVGGIRPLRDIPDSSKQKYSLALTPPDLPSTTLTGFMIHTPFCSLHRLNYSAKMGYSLGRL